MKMFLQCAAVLLCVCCQLTGAYAQSPQKPAVVILTAGQSNTDGRVMNDDLPDYIVRDGYRFCQWSYGSGPTSGKGRFVPFYPRIAQSKTTGKFAYDAITYYLLEQSVQEPFYVIKESLGGTSIDTLCSSTMGMRWSADPAYLAREAAADKGGKSLLKALTENIGACIDGQLSQLSQGYDIKCLLWHQGESDRKAADRYKENLREVVAYVRRYLVEKTGQKKYARLPIICGTVSHRSKQYNPKVEAALYELAKEDRHFHVVDMQEETLLSDSLHFDAQGAEALGRKMFGKMVELKLADAVETVDLKRSTIVVSSEAPALVKKMAGVMADDVERVTGVRPTVTDRLAKRACVVLTMADNETLLRQLGVDASDIRGGWERYKIVTKGQRLIIVGSDERGLAYGVLHVSERIGVNPWYWFADVPVVKQEELRYAENYTSESPSVKYRGIFINDEDWGLKTWAARNFEKDLEDIGPKTYEKVCELLLRLKGNMLAPAMHSCTGAFYSHPESQQVAAEWGIMVTTSHCEPLLFNNAAKSEWDKAVDGEWNYLTNKETIWKKLDNRIRETAQYDNIYTMGMRGLHDEAMKGSTDPKVRARTLETVFADQRLILESHKGKAATDIPQIFVPYKETLDIYDAGLRVPDDITLVWPDDNYGYMKRVSNATERLRKGGAGVYYHLSYLGTPHDNLWLATTAAMLMYTELKKAYDAGADRYWLLNVGDIKPMEVEMQQFFDMAWNFGAFTYENVNHAQAKWLSSIYGKKYERELQQILDTYYRLAWDRKPEFMGYEMEWDSEENNRLHDTDFSFETGTAQKRLADYQDIADRCVRIEQELPEAWRASFFEMLGYSVQSAHQMNRKFLMAQRNHETGSEEAAQAAVAAHDSINLLLNTYNTLLDGKWNQMLSQIPPGYCAKYQQMPEVCNAPTAAHALPLNQQHTEYPHRIDLRQQKMKQPFRLLEGIGTDWFSLQMGEPLDPVQDPTSLLSDHIDYEVTIAPDALSDSLQICISVIPFWPVSLDRSNRIGISLDGCTPVVCENRFEEWSFPWKLQVLENRKEYLLTFPIDRHQPKHTLSLIIGDPGQMVQKITWK